MRGLINTLTTKNAKSSAFFYFGSFGLNIGNYLFHFLLLRLLSPASYGEFLSYIAFISLITIPAATIATTVTKYVSDFLGQKDYIKVNRFFYKITKHLFPYVLLIAILVIIFSKQLAIPLKAQPLAFTVLGISIISSFFTAIVSSYLVALQKFKFIIFSGLIEIITKISTAYLLISGNFEALGGVIAILAASFLGLAIMAMKVKPYVFPSIKVVKNLNIKFRKFFTYSIIMAAGSVSLISVDVLLVRYFFSPETSGIYSALSILGRMIYFGLTPLAVIMLPVVSKKFSSKNKTKHILYKLGGVTIIFGIMGVGLFLLNPLNIVRLLSGTNYHIAGNLLALFAVSMLLLAVSRMLLMYFMAVGHQRANLLFLLAILLQPLIIWYHHQSLEQIVQVNLIIQSTLFLSFLVYYKVALKEVR